MFQINIFFKQDLLDKGTSGTKEQMNKRTIWNNIFLTKYFLNKISENKEQAEQENKWTREQFEINIFLNKISENIEQAEQENKWIREQFEIIFFFLQNLWDQGTSRTRERMNKRTVWNNIFFFTKSLRSRNKRNKRTNEQENSLK